MYQFKRSIVRYTTGPAGLMNYDVSKVLLNAFYQYFKEVIIVFGDSLYNKDYSIKYSDYQAEWSAYNGTIQQWLDTNKDKVLKTYDAYPAENYRTVTLHDIQYEWFTLLPGNANREAKDQDLIELSSAPDIRIHKTDNSDVDYPTLNKCTLWLVNNHFVRNVSDDTNIYLMNAGKHYRINDNIHVCCWNFNGIGNVTTSNIKKEDFHFTTEGSVKHLKIKTKEDLTNKTVWLVIGGRLYMNDIVNVSGDNAVTVNINKVDWFDKIMTSRTWIDLTNVIDKDVVAVGKDFFNKESFFENLLTDLSTFFVLIDNPDLVVSHVPVGNYEFPFTYYTERTEKLPLLLSNGLMPKYGVRKAPGLRLLDIDAGLHKRYVFHSTGINNGELQHQVVNLGFSERYNRGYLLEIKALVQ